MSKDDRAVVITGNWKMYKTIEEATAFVKELIPLVQDAPVSIYLAVPFTAIRSVAELVKGSSIKIGAQNMNDVSEGAFTGEIAGKMLKEAGAEFVILGHSERRRFFNETNDLIHKKVVRALEDGLQPVLCIGESKEERDRNETEEVLQKQLQECLAGIKSEQASQLMIAYEPVWAIGTFDAATPEVAEEAHAFCRKCLGELFGEEVAGQIVIQYGGSVVPENAAAFLQQEDIDGLLVGGASLSAEKFSKIVNMGKL